MKRIFSRLPAGWIALCLILAWFNTGIEKFRHGDLGDIPEHHLKLFSPPWLPLRAYVSRNGDEHHYFEYSKLILGEDPDIDYLVEVLREKPIQGRAKIMGNIRPGHSLRLPYRDFFCDYPPVSLIPMLIPRLFVDTLPAYRVAYGILAALLTILTCYVGSQLASELTSSDSKEVLWKRMAYTVLAMGPIIVERFDILPALLVATAILCIIRNRPFIAGLCMGVGIMTKLYPLLLLAPWIVFLIAQGRYRLTFRLISGTVIAALLIAAPFLWLTPVPFIKSTFIYGQRPFQLETIIASLAVLINGKSVLSESFGSYNMITPHWLRTLWAPVLPLSILISCAAIGYQARTRTHGRLADQLIHWTIALLYFILLTSKVLSPQFLIWLLPLITITPNLKIRHLAMISMVLTQIFFPFLAGFYNEDGNRLAALLVIARNLCLILLLVESFRWAYTSGTEELPCPTDASDWSPSAALTR